MEFEAFPKVPRLNRDVIVTEKIDGTNACIIISKPESMEDFKAGVETCTAEVGAYLIHCQSRKRIIQPAEIGGKGADNMGFAAWVADHCEQLTELGEGRHYGEWWGQGIQRGYGLDHKRFSLFNVHRWHDSGANGMGEAAVPACCNVVPVLQWGQLRHAPWDEALFSLEQVGSYAAPGYDNPEGVMVFHTAARSLFKVTLDGDEAKGGTYPGMHAS